MNPIDLTIFILYLLGMLGVGFYHLRRNEGAEDYYVGGRQMGATHIGLSVVATDVGGGFSIGLGGLGFVMGLSGSWLLFTGLLGAWISAVVLIPRVRRHPGLTRALTFPDFLKESYNAPVALVAGIISAIGYLGFTSSQILAGAKLAEGTFVFLDRQTALLVMGATAVGYTVLGGFKAVVYTDTIQWIILMVGLTFFGLPICYHYVGGWEAIRATLPAEMFSLTAVSPSTFINWMITILPIWFVGMTLYQRIYACRDEKTAQRAWYLAGLFEWPVMAFLGVILGLMGRVAAEQGLFAPLGVQAVGDMDSETGLPMLLRIALPVGAMGVVLSAYFSAILSTADSCLMASSGNVVSDIVGRITRMPDGVRLLRISQLVTLALGVVALALAWVMTSVLDLMLYSYAFMVSGLLVPVLGALFWKRRSSTAAVLAMVVGGTTTVALAVSGTELPLGLDPNAFGLAASAIVFVGTTLWVGRDVRGGAPARPGYSRSEVGTEG
ncbi:MAG: sodium:solute symporter family protein [Candidatus Eisenbacteria bacterium]